MADEKVIQDLEDMKTAAEASVMTLDRLYYHPEFGTVRTRPIISMMIAAAKYFRDNIVVLEGMYGDKFK